MNALRIRGFALPDAEPADLYAAGDRWTDDPVADPRTDLAQLDAPRAVILCGQLIHRRP